MSTRDIPQPIVAAAIPSWSARPVPSPPYTVGILPGEGVGPEVVRGALTVLDAVADAHGLAFDPLDAPVLGARGPFGPELTRDLEDFFTSVFAAGGAVMCGAISGRFVYDLRARFELFCKLAPIRPSPALTDMSIVRPERTTNVDVLIVRENVGGLYQGEFGRRDSGRVAYQQLEYREEQVDCVTAVALRASQLRSGRLALVTKPGGVPEVSALWRERVQVAAAAFDAEVEELDIDNACFQLVANAHRFDVVVAPNLFGDVLTDAGALLLGSRGMAVSANFGDSGRAVYQTAHGAAYDLAGTDTANPVAQILSLAMLLRESFGLDEAARCVELAVESVLASGFRTSDVAGPASTIVGTRELVDRIAEAVSDAFVRLGAG